MPKIVKLSSKVVNQIAAGEVIERPAAVVKELVENSLDAGARQIEVDVREGGSKAIRVRDDGHGITADDLDLVFDSHATSKISSAEDLDAVATLGFRGEALASIGAVARCQVISRIPGEEAGAEVRCDAGLRSEVACMAAAPGTTVEVEDLFCNTPVRRKFQKSKGTEQSHVIAAVTRLALGHPEVGFVLRHDDREVFRLHPEESLAARIGRLFGADVERDLIPVRASGPQRSLHGFVLPLQHSRRDTNGIYTYVRGRFVRDRVILSAVARAYRELLPPGRHPLVFLFLDMEPSEVDVNVHPTKTEVRFRRSGEIHALFSAAVAEAVRVPGASPPAVRVASHGFGAAPAGHTAVRERTAGAPSGSLFARPTAPGTSEPHSLRLREPAGSDAVARYDDRRAYQLHDAFIVEETPEGISIIDQHALHERILTERIRQRALAGGLPAQRLLMPTVARLCAAEIETLLQLREELLRFGVEIDRFGDEEVAVHALPSMLADKLGESGVLDLLTSLVASARECEQAAGSTTEAASRFLDRAIYSMACRAAVKIGDPLSPTEIHAILQMRDDLADGALTCPHGRPSTLRLTLDELRKRFERE